MATIGGGSTGTGSGTSVRSSNQTVPSPPEPAVIANSIAATCGGDSLRFGPHANEICRFRMRSVVHCRAYSKFTRLHHQTFSPLASMSLNSRFCGGVSPRSWYSKR